MAIQVEQVYKTSMKPYEMKLIAGKEGLTNIISWVHILENVVVKGYVRGNEFVFTTGIVYQNNDWLLTFVQGLYEYHASGLAVNMGTYIKEIPQEVIDYCDEHRFPLFLIPWHIHLVDMTRDICSQIVKDKHDEESASSLFKEVLFAAAETANLQTELNRFGFDANANYCIVLIELISQQRNNSNNDNKYDNKYDNNDQLKIAMNTIKMILDKTHQKQNIFIRNNIIVTIISELEYKKIKKLTVEIIRIFEGQQYSFTARIGVGKRVDNIDGLIKSYNYACQSIKLAQKWKEIIIYYDEIGIYKLLIEGQKEVLNEIYQETIGTLEKMDQANHTDYVEFLRMFINYNGNIQTLADEMFVHRNTIHYKRKQIEKYIGCDMNKMEDRFKIMLALKIQKVL